MMTRKICVIGAGASGLATLKALGDAGVPFDCFELGSDIGGLWRYRNDSGLSPLYRGLHINTSKRMMQFSDIPMPRHWPHYPHHSQIWQYFSDYADRFGLRPRITFRTAVERVEPQDGGRGGYLVTTRHRDTGATRAELYGGVVVCSGHHWSPKRVRFPGSFDGEQLHAFDYDAPEPFAGKRVLVVGIGNSAVDIAVETSYVAARTLLSTRHSAWILPRFAFGRPIDELNLPASRLLPLPLKRLLYHAVLRASIGDQRGYGIPRPDHKLLHAHPTISSALLERAAYGAVQIKPDIAELRGDRVRFADGSEEPVDVLIAATGYTIEFPFFDPAVLSAADNQIALYRRVVHPELPNLFFVGLVQVIGALMPVAELQARWVAGLLSGRLALPDRATMLRVIAEEERALRRRFISSSRHTIEVDYWPYIFTLRRALRGGLDRPRGKLGRGAPQEAANA
jgi:cation diffusion facilitator CzcD-associated flavoprotein CzcO